MHFIIVKKNHIMLAVSVILIIALIVGSVTVVETITETYSHYVIIDAGHGGFDSGGIGKTTGISEASINLNIALKLKKLFESNGIGVIMTRYDSKSPANTKRQDMDIRKNIIQSNEHNLVISIHCNISLIPSRRGVQIFYGNKEKDYEYSNYLQKIINANLNVIYTNRGYDALEGDYFILKCSNAPSCIIECGFLSNEQDEKLLKTESYLNELCFQIFSGTIGYLSATNAIRQNTV